MKKLFVLIACLLLICTGCSQGEQNTDQKNVYKIGICNYVDDASLNQIYENIVSELDLLSKNQDFTFEINYDNANADANIMSQIISNFIADDVDLMVGIATPVAMNMQALTEDNQIPVVFAAVSDPLAVELVDSLEKPGANITGTSDYLDTDAMMNLIKVLNPEIKKVGLLYDVSQDSSTSAINQAKEYLNSNNIEIIEKTGTNVDEIKLAVQSLISQDVEAIFTPSDNTVMTAELSIYENLMNAGIPHFAGADSFALNGAFLGYGVDYANLGKETADMVYEILVNNGNPADMAVKTFDNGIITINNEVAAKLNLNISDLEELFKPYSTKIQTIDTAEEFE